MKKKLLIQASVLLILMTGLYSSNLTAQCMNDDPSDEGITPDLVSGNPALCTGGKRIDPPASGTYNLDGITGNDVIVTITDGTCGEVMSWSVPDHIVIDHVIAKGGSDANDYDYTGTGIQSDGNLHCPIAGGSGKYADFSHIDFCFHYRLSASKTANAEFTRTYVWSIDKSCDGPSELTLSEGQVYNYPFSWTVDATGYDTDHKVTGTITVANNTPSSATITGISDVLSGGEAATVDCGTSFPYVLAAGSTLNCTYSANLAAPYDGTNTVTVTTNTANVEGDVATADFEFGKPTTVVDDCITVTDDCTTSTEVCVGDAPYTLEYTCPISYSECGEYTYTNTASFTTNHSGTEGSDDCTVSVNVPCGGGCTHTIGYWKTHSEFGPAPYDDTWAQLSNGASTSFFLSGQTYYQVAWKSPAGNAYYILAHQYIAAQLNQLDGASIPSAVLTAFNTATTLLSTYTPAQIGALKGSSPLRKQFIELAGILDQYNNGITGPGHCSEENGHSGKPAAETRSFTTAPAIDFSVSPNPASDAVQIDLSNFMDKSIELVVYNQLGAAVQNRSIEKVDASVYTLRFDKVLPDGIYNVTLLSDGRRLSKSLVVNK